MIKAIETKYKGHKFRSRLEARWAVYFDALNVKWLYENEGYELGNGEAYLPDFYLPKYKIYLEVKPEEFSYQEHSKCKRLALLFHRIVVELVGLPSFDSFNVLVPYKYMMCPTHGQQTAYEDKRSHICKCGQKHQVFDSLYECLGTLLLKSKKDSYTPIYYGAYQSDGGMDNLIEDAIEKAKSAQFEFKNKK